MKTSINTHMEEYGFVYIWFDRKHKRYYIGSHWGTEDDGYICSSKWMKDAYRRRPQDFGKRRTISRVYTNREALLEEEQRWLNMIKPSEVKIRYYNLRLYVTKTWYLDKDSKERVSQKISEAKSGRSFSEEHRRKLSDAQRGRKRSDEMKKKVSSFQRGRPKTEAQKLKTSQALKGKKKPPLSREHRQKISSSRKKQLHVDRNSL